MRTSDSTNSRSSRSPAICCQTRPLWQKVASGFNRLNLTTEEGGAQAKDYEQRTVADRVRAIGTVWLAQTTGCAQCHDHKFDPITARDFYQLGAFFADIKESAIGRREDGLPVPTPEQEAQLKGLDARELALQTRLNAESAELDAAQADWEKCTLARIGMEQPWQPLVPMQMTSAGGATLTREDGEIDPRDRRRGRTRCFHGGGCSAARQGHWDPPGSAREQPFAQPWSWTLGTRQLCAH